MNSELNAFLMEWVSRLNDPLWNFLVILLLAVGLIGFVAQIDER